MSADESRARAYAAWARSGADISFAPTLACVLGLLPPAPRRVLDVGCGEGRVGDALVARGYDVVGVDSAPLLVELARHEALVADASSLPFESASFNVVTCVYMLMELDDLAPALDEMARVLSPGGMLVAVVDHPFVSGQRVASYSQPDRFSWSLSHDGVDLQLGGVHRSLGAYVEAFEHAGLSLVSLREIAAGSWDPMTLALAFRRTSDTVS